MSKKQGNYTKLDEIIDIQVFEESVEEFFKHVPDPRVEDNKKYSLSLILVIMLMAVTSGANSILAIFDYAEEKQYLIKEYFDIDEIPQYRVFWWVLTRMNPIEFSTAFQKWTNDIRIKDIPDKVINVDGKCLRGARNKKGNQNVHLVHAWSSKEGLLLGQLKTDEKSNEITAIPALLDMIDIEGATITIDAAGCQKKIVEQIYDKNAYYVIAVKENQPALYNECVETFEAAHEINFHYVSNSDLFESLEKEHGRIENRKIAICGDKSEFPEDIKKSWKGLETFIEVTSERTVKGKTSIEKRYYISNLIESAQEFGARIRSHWSVENPLHWVLDLVFREDESRANTLHAAENLATLRRMSLNYLNLDTETKLGTAQQRRRAGWGDGIVKKMLTSIFSQRNFNKKTLTDICRELVLNNESPLIHGQSAPFSFQD